MNLKHLRTFVAVAEQGTVSKAAGALRVTQPALSRQIDELERELGFQLFERIGRRLQLTARGIRILDDARSLLTHAAALNERAQALRQGEIGLLKVAATAWLIEGAFPTFLHQYAERVPGVKVVLVEAKAADHLGMLKAGEVHLAATIIHSAEGYDDAQFACHWLPHLHVVAAGMPSPEVAPADAIDIRHLVKHPLLLPKSRFATRGIFDAACHVAGVAQNVFFESGTPHTLLALAAAGHGMAILPSIMPVDRWALQFMRVTHRQAPLRIAPAVLWDKKQTPGIYAEAFAELLTEHMLKAFPQAHATENPTGNPPSG